jgi:hypothetical protein
MHTKRTVEVRLWFSYIAGFQGRFIKTTLTGRGGSEEQNNTTMLSNTREKNVTCIMQQTVFTFALAVIMVYE